MLLRLAESGVPIVGTPGQFLRCIDGENWEVAALPPSAPENLSTTLATGNDAGNQQIVNLAEPTNDLPESSGQATNQGYVLRHTPRRTFKNDLVVTIDPGLFADVSVPFTDAAPGDIAGAYMTTTSAGIWPDVEMSVRLVTFGSVLVRLRNFGAAPAVITGGSLTFYIQNCLALAL